MRPVYGFLLAAVLASAPAAAQEAPIVSLAPDEPARWDVAASTGWRGGNKADIAPEWDEWYDAATFDVSLGYSWTAHVKTEFGLSTTTTGSVFVDEEIVVPGQTAPVFRYGERQFRSTLASGALVYQFGENAWFHPFVSGGIEVARERARLELDEQVFCVRLPCTPAPLPVVEPSVSYRALPFSAAGFKWYMTERAFVRSEVRAAFSSSNVVDAVTWRVGIGADF